MLFCSSKCLFIPIMPPTYLGLLYINKNHLLTAWTKLLFKSIWFSVTDSWNITYLDGIKCINMHFEEQNIFPVGYLKDCQSWENL